MTSSRIDRTTQASGLLNHFWVILMSDDNLRKAARLRYISHMLDERPYWYLWHQDCSGVYELDLLGAQAIDGYDWLAEIAVKYYPSKDEPWHEGLSFLEKVCRASEAFQTLPSAGGGCPCHSSCQGGREDRFADLADGTGAPSFAFKNTIPPNFFYAGHLCIAFNEAAGSVIRLKTQTSWQVAITQDHTISDGSAQPLAFFRKGAIDRNYPGFAISDFINQRLVKNWSSFHQYRFHSERTWKGEGVKFLSDGKNITTESSRQIERIIVETELLCRPGGALAFVPDDDLEGMLW